MNFNRQPMQQNNNDLGNNEYSNDENVTYEDDGLGDFDVNNVFMDVDDNGEPVFGVKDNNPTPSQNNVIAPQNNQVPSNNFNISATPEYQALLQQTQTLQSQLQQTVEYIRANQNRPKEEPIDFNEMLQDPNKFQAYTEKKIAEGVQQQLAKLAPQFQQVQQTAQVTQQQQAFQNAYQQASNRYSDFEQVLGSDQNKALNYIRSEGSFDAAYAKMKNEILNSKGRPTQGQQRKQRVKNVEYAGNNQGNNGMQPSRRVYSKDAAEDSVMQAMAEMFRK